MTKHGQIQFSLLSQMYAKWTQFQIPVTFYHYFLTILKLKSKSQQNLLMQRQISSLKTGSHLYLKIKSTIEARENSLKVIRENLHLLNSQQVLSKPLNNNIQQREVLGYKKLFQSKQLSQQRSDNRALRQLANHLILYRKITLQIVFLIHKWMAQIMSQGYQGQMQFIYNNEDYLESITQNTLQTLKQYNHIFELNPFFILKKGLASGKYELVYQFLKISNDYAKNLYEALKLLSEHHANILRQQLLKKHELLANKKKISKSSSLDKLYGNLLGGKQYYMIKDSYLKSDKLVQKQNSTIQSLSKNKSQVKHKKYLKSLQKPPLLINPQKYPRSNFIQRKYPTFFSDNTQNQSNKKRSNQITNILLQRKYSSGVETIKHKNSIILNNHIEFNPQNRINNGLEDEYKLKMLYQIDQQRNFIRNNEKQRSRQLQKINNALKQSKMDRNQELVTTQSRMNLQQSINQFNNIQRSQSRINIDLSQSKPLSQEQQIDYDKIQVKTQKNLHPTNLIKYLRSIFKNKFLNPQNYNNVNNQSHEQSIEKLIRLLLKQRKSITIYKILYNQNQYQNQGLFTHKREKSIISNHKNQNLVAWIVCKLYKDNTLLQKTVDLIYFLQFKNQFNLRKIIIDHFKSIGYCNLKENGKLVHQSNLTTFEQSSVQVVRVKYKVSPFAQAEQIKQLVKGNTTLKLTRLLKYHYYNKVSKYHKFCDHRSKQGTCSLGYYFDNVQKIFIQDKPYIKAKITQLVKRKQCYQIYNSSNKNKFLIMATTIEDLKTLQFDLYQQNKNMFDHDSSYEQQDNQIQVKNQYNYICFEEAKIMRKYVNQRDKPIINEFLWIENNIPEIRSIAFQKNDIIGSDCLVATQPYIMAIYAKFQDQGWKSLAVLDFTQ